MEKNFLIHQQDIKLLKLMQKKTGKKIKYKKPTNKKPTKKTKKKK